MNGSAPTHAVHFSTDIFTSPAPRITLIDPSDPEGSAVRDALQDPLTDYFVLTSSPDAVSNLQLPKHFVGGTYYDWPSVMHNATQYGRNIRAAMLQMSVYSLIMTRAGVALAYNPERDTYHPHPHASELDPTGAL